jgi:uncharacterized protein YbcI
MRAKMSLFTHAVWVLGRDTSSSMAPNPARKAYSFLAEVEPLDAPARPPGADIGAGTLNAALARAVVRIHRSVVGRGPTKAQAFFRQNVIVVVMREVLTPMERTLAANNDAETVRDIRRTCKQAMLPGLQEAVESLTGCGVEVCLGDTDVEADTAVLVFTLDRPVTFDDAGAPA